MIALVTVVVAATLALASPQAVTPPPVSAIVVPTQRSTADSILEARTTEVAKGLRCPICQGLSIQDSPSEISQQMRALVKEQLRAGKSPDDVRAYFVSKYSEWILLAPEAKGFNLVAYFAPALLFLGGLGTIALVVRRWTAAGESAGESAVAQGAVAADAGQSTQPD